MGGRNVPLAAAFETAVEATMDGVAVLDEDGTYRYVNESYLDVFGYEREELRGESWRTTVAQSDREGVSEAIRVDGDGGRWRGEVAGLRHDGTTVPVELVVATTDDGVVWVVREVGERHDRTEELRAQRDALRDERTFIRNTLDALREERAFVRGALNAIPDAFYVVDTDGTFLRWNDRLPEKTGYSDDEMADMTVRDLLPPEEREPVMEALRRIVDGEQLGIRESELVTKSGERIDYEFSGSRITDSEGQVIGVAGTGRDITERKKHEREVQLERDRFRALFENLGEPVGEAVIEDGEPILQRVNDAFKDAFDVGEEVIGQNADDLFVPEGEMDVAKELTERTQRGETVEQVVRRGTDEIRPYLFRSAIFEGPDGRPHTHGIYIDISELKDRERELQLERDRFRALFENLGEPVVEAVFEDGDPIVERVNGAFEDAFGVGEAAVGENLDDLIVPEGDEDAPIINDRAKEGESVEREVRRGTDEVRPYLFRSVPFEGPDGRQRGHGIYIDITEQKARQGQLERQRDQLARLDRINATVQEVIRSLIGATSREGVERRVCEGLTATDLYDFAWVGIRSNAGIEPRTAAGIDVDAVTAALETGDGRAVDRALQDGEVRVVHSGEAMAELAWSSAGFDRAFESLAVVPLSYGSAVYGVLVVHVDREDAFSESELAGFETLGQAAGLAINAVRHRKHLLADATTRIEFTIEDERLPTCRLTANRDVRTVLQGTVPAGDGSMLIYASYEGIDAETVEEFVDRTERIDEVRIIAADDDGCLAELHVSGVIPTVMLTERGARVESVVVEDGEAHYTVEIAPDVNVRELLDTIGSTFGGAELVSKRNAHPAEDRRDVSRTLDRELSERQRAALEVAYRAGYFEWPRASTAEEVAESMDIASPTFHSHLRKAQKRILETLFDAEQ